MELYPDFKFTPIDQVRLFIYTYINIYIYLQIISLNDIYYIDFIII